MTPRLLLALTVACLIALSACGGGDPDDDIITTAERDVPPPASLCAERPEVCR